MKVKVKLYFSTSSAGTQGGTCENFDTDARVIILGVATLASHFLG